MSWNRLYTPGKDIGTIAEIYLNEDKTLIKKIYKVDGITVSGKATEFNEASITNAFDTELRWLKELKSKWVPELIDEGENWLTQRYYGEDLLENYMRKTLWDDVPNITEQVIEMYTFFKEKNIFKRNGSLSNLTTHKGQLIAFDFKWTRQRPTGIEMELQSYDEWLIKINDTLPATLRGLI